jgi:predicted O-linked N-acetylglucosamine transferase (SPINDLY family)
MAKPIADRQGIDLSEMLTRALELHQSGRLTEAEPLYRQILRARPKHPEARHYLGVLRFQQGRTKEALDLIAVVLAANADYAEAHYNYGNILAALNRHADALASYERATALEPNYAEAHHNRGNALFTLRRLDEAIVSYDRALAIEPRYIGAWNSRGTALKELKRHAEALDCYEKVLALVPDEPNALYCRGNALKEIKRHEESLLSYDKARKLLPEHPDKFGGLDSALAACDFARTDAIASGLNADLQAGKASVTPFTLVGFCDDPALHLKAARNFAAERIPVRPAPLWNGEIYRHDRIRIAYVSTDLQAHATAFLMAELFELHDRSRFEVHAFSSGPDDGGAMRRRIAKACDHFHDVAGENDAEIARRMRLVEIDIAVDLKGFTQDSRPEIFGYRPAPIQVAYLGYPGTIGADLLDYILADETVAPLEHAPFYSEKIVHLPDCYQVNDRKRAIAEHTPSRQEAGLPDAGFVFCCFNNNYKIRKPIFDIWMRLLREVPGSVLWLLRDTEAAERNLRSEALAHGIDPARLVFAGRVALDEHLARQRLAGLFLDTLPYNAHTTASDALWAGLPIVTCQGDAFAGRVAASLLKAVGLPELITHTLDDYEALALRLARDPAMLQRIRETLARNRLTYPLFDTDRFRCGIEAAYLRMWETWQRGAATQAFRIEPIA